MIYLALMFSWIKGDKKIPILFSHNHLYVIIPLYYMSENRNYHFLLLIFKHLELDI